MSNILVVYYSRYGATKQYANWIAEELGADILEYKKCKLKDLMNYSTIVYGGGIYSGGIYGVDLITKNCEKHLRDKKIICFGVGISIENEENQKQCIEVNFKKRFLMEGLDDNGNLTNLDNEDSLGFRELLKEKLMPIDVFFLPGAYNPKFVKGFDKLIMKITRKMMVDNMGNENVIKYIDNGCNLVGRDKIAEIVDFIKLHNN